MTRRQGQGSGPHQTSAKAISTTAKKIRALELRKAGKSLQEIADIMGYATRDGPSKLILRALEESVREPREELRELELQRLDAMWSTLWTRFRRGMVAVAPELLRVSQRRAKLLGLDSAEKRDVTVHDGESDADLVVQVRELLAVLDKQAKTEGSDDAGDDDPKGAVADG
jgi:hypothetical protein